VIGQIGRELPEPEHAIQAAIVLLLLLAFVGAPQGRASFLRSQGTMSWTVCRSFVNLHSLM
jgi:hypothetical protein